MTREELRRILASRTIRKDTYCLDGGLPNDAMCLNQRGKIWEVYYSERGGKFDLQVFHTEEEACESFYNRLME